MTQPDRGRSGLCPLERTAEAVTRVDDCPFEVGLRFRTMVDPRPWDSERSWSKCLRRKRRGSSLRSVNHCWQRDIIKLSTESIPPASQHTARTKVPTIVLPSRETRRVTKTSTVRLDNPATARRERKSVTGRLYTCESDWLAGSLYCAQTGNQATR